MDKVLGLFGMFIILAGVAVAVSNRAQTAKVLNALLGGFADIQRASVSPVTGK